MNCYLLNPVPTLFRALCFKITIFNKSSQGAFADQDPTALDFSVNVKLGKLRFVFLGYFVAHLQVRVMLMQSTCISLMTYMTPGFARLVFISCIAK